MNRRMGIIVGIVFGLCILYIVLCMVILTITYTWTVFIPEMKDIIDEYREWKAEKEEKKCGMC